MHNWEKDGNTDGRCTKASDDGKWCKGNYGQTVSAQSGGLIKNPRFECQGGVPCEWNNTSGHQFWSTPTSGVTSIRGETWAGSRSVQLRLCADEDVPRIDDQVTNHASWILSKGAGFVVEVPSGSKAILNVRLANGSAVALEAGKSNNILTVISTSTAGNVTKWSYLVNRG
jgi:hypothetical protein